MATVYDVDATQLIETVAPKLQEMENIDAPEWSLFAKTGVHKERAPDREDWWYIRSAAVLRSVYERGPIGVSKLRTKYGGKRDRGHKTEHFYKGSGAVIRNILQQLEKEGLVEKKIEGLRKGRVITAKGKSLLDKTATDIFKNG